MDEILKQLFKVSKEVLVDMLNSLFGKDIDPEKTEIEVSNSEFVTEELGLLKGDLFLTLSGSEKNRFHIEFQTVQDRGMVIRMFEYGFHKARELAGFDDREETVIIIPEQVVIFVEEHESVRDELKMRLVFPGDQEMTYRVPVIKYWQYDYRDLLQKKLYPLLPLQIFKLRRELEKLRKQKEAGDNIAAKMAEVQKVAELVATEAKNLYDQNLIPGEDLHRILVAVESLFEYLNLKYAGLTELNEEVYKMVKTLYDPEVERRGIEKGIEQGIEQGFLKGELKARRKTVYSLVEKKLGSIPEHLVELIEQADCQTLTRILDDIFDIDSFSELDSYFPPEE